MTKDGLKQPNYFGSLTQAATLRLGNYKGEEVFTPFKSLLPMVKPEDIVFGGWDISSYNLADAMERAQVWLRRRYLGLQAKRTPLNKAVLSNSAAAMQMLYVMRFLAVSGWTSLVLLGSSG